MMIIGCDYHPSWQQICWVDTLTGETEEKKLEHASGEAERFYRQLPGPAVIGMESTGNCQWFVEMATAAGHEVWIGDAAKIRASEVRQQKNDRRDAAQRFVLLDIPGSLAVPPRGRGEDAVEAAWAVVEPILTTHHRARPYEIGSWGPKAADELIAADGCWHNPRLKDGAG